MKLRSSYEAVDVSIITTKQVQMKFTVFSHYLGNNFTEAIALRL